MLQTKWILFPAEPANTIQDGIIRRGSKIKSSPNDLTHQPTGLLELASVAPASDQSVTNPLIREDLGRILLHGTLSMARESVFSEGGDQGRESGGVPADAKFSRSGIKEAEGLGGTASAGEAFEGGVEGKRPDGAAELGKQAVDGLEVLAPAEEVDD